MENSFHHFFHFEFILSQINLLCFSPIVVTDLGRVQPDKIIYLYFHGFYIAFVVFFLLQNQR